MKPDHLEKIIELRHRLHACPELSLQEHRTKETLMEFLRAHTCLEVVDRGRWFYAYYDCGKPEAGAVAFRADFDAVPVED
ncbi:MAG: amidohydrolase, partial [Lachnospiraceae bacterium]|nr:amidohydrolase [Lachnospiraceae bacterium]